MIKSDAEIYKHIEKVIKKSGDTPITCNQVWDASTTIQQLAGDTSRLSDHLSHMWRRGMLQRYYAANSNTTRARFAYTWKEEEHITPQKLADAKRPQLRDVNSATAGPKPHVVITEEEGKITLDFPQFTITVVSK